MEQLGDFTFSSEAFPGENKAWKEFSLSAFQHLSEQRKFERVSHVLLGLINDAPEESFLLPAVLHFIERVHADKILDHFHFNHFELWLNQFSGLNAENNRKIRGKIAGRWVPREAYQELFPVGMGKIYPGSHFVTAHGSPDLDTTVASFWGWVDAFAARVSEGLHIWNVPGGKPPAQIEIGLLFEQLFGKEVFSHLAKHRTLLSVSGLDLVTQEGIEKKQLTDSLFGIDHEKGTHSVLLVDAQGGYVGEWRSADAERVQAVINLLNQCLRWYENSLHVKLISIFATKKLKKTDLEKLFKSAIQMKLKECQPAQEFTKRQNELLQDLLQKVLGLDEGLEGTFAQFAKAMASLSLVQFQQFMALLKVDGLFDAKGALIENRETLFRYLAQVIGTLENAIYSIRQYVDRLFVALQVKSKVLGLVPHHINYRADVDEIRTKIGPFPYLTVTATDREGKPFPVGVIKASDIFKTPIGTVTVRDFSNREETKIPFFLEVISIIDHHKSQLSTSLPSVVSISDVQSCNTLVAELTFKITDSYSTGGMSQKEVQKQMAAVQKNLSSAAQRRILQRLLQKSLALEKKGSYFVSPQREMVEYFHFLFAILDDTDLLTKVSPRDLICVASLINRLKSLSVGREVEVIHLEEIAQDDHFKPKAALKILQNPDMYSLYRKIYTSKADALKENLHSTATGKNLSLFADTKEQGGCARVGQTKIFTEIFPLFEKSATALRKAWVEECLHVVAKNPEIDLHLYMVSTIPSAEELYQGKGSRYSHFDELWIWSPLTEVGIEHLKEFLSQFKNSPAIKSADITVELVGTQSKELKEIFEESFKIVSFKISKGAPSLAIVRFAAGLLNSRKAMVSPYLPHLN
jgi:hypothetical protein